MKALPITKRNELWFKGEKSLQNPDLGSTGFNCATQKSQRHGSQEPRQGRVQTEGGDGGPGSEKLRLRLDLKHTGMAVIIDLADAHNPNDIHPKNKQDAGGRLAQWALNQT